MSNGGNITKRYLGIDWGEVRIGLAIGDSETKISSPFGIVPDLEGILEVIKKEEIDEIVLGMPFQISDIQYQVSDRFDNFKKELADKVDIPIHEVDERLSSKAADALPGNKSDKAPRDAVAAMLILQSYLEKEVR